MRGAHASPRPPARQSARHAQGAKSRTTKSAKAQKRIRGTLYAARALRRAMSSAVRAKRPRHGAVARGGRGARHALRRPCAVPACRARGPGIAGRRMRGAARVAPPARGPCMDARPGATSPHEPQPTPAPAARAAPARGGCTTRCGRHRRSPRKEADGPRAGRAPAPPAVPPHRVASGGAARPGAERGAP